jgi:crotonobetainyl-CoA:carnitine CoA-transferase CaiB-like acyl-CoA transferase
VVDFSTHFPGPLASRHLSQLGADVIKVENRETGDGNRGTPPFVEGESPFHHFLNAGARSIAIDSRSPAWLRVTEALAGWADVVIVGNRPSTAARLHLDFERLVKVNDDLVYCLITGYGLAGPWSGYPAHGLNPEAYAGTIPLEWLADGRPTPRDDFRATGVTMAGVEAAIGILAALYRRDQGLGAQHVHVSMWESALSWLWRDVVVQLNTGTPWRGNKDIGPRYSTYRTADNRVILVCPTEQHFWERFCDVVGMPEGARSRGDWSSGADRGREFPQEYGEIQQRMATRTLDEWLRLLGDADVPVAPILDWTYAIDSDHARANGVLASIRTDKVEMQIPAIPVSVVSVGAGGPVDAARLAEDHKNKTAAVRSAPKLGQHSDEILAELGLSELTDQLSKAGS